VRGNAGYETHYEFRVIGQDALFKEFASRFDQRNEKISNFGLDAPHPSLSRPTMLFGKAVPAGIVSVADII